MKKQSLLLGFALMGLLTSCSQEIDDVMNNSGKKAIFNINITPMTRTATEGLVTTFVKDDKIGIFAGNNYSNIRYTLGSDNAWTGQDITFDNSTTFHAYYPYNETYETNTFNYTVDIDQSTGYNQSDLLLAKTSQVNTGSEVTLTFEHALALVEVDASALEESITSITLQAIAESTVNLENKMATSKTSTDVMPAYIQMYKINNNVYRAVVPAQTLKAGKRIFISTETTAYTCTIQDATLAAAQLNKFTIGKDGENVNFKISGGVKDWENGSIASSQRSDENFIKTTLDDFTKVLCQKNYSNIPMESWFYRYNSATDIDDENGFAKIEHDNNKNVLHVKMAENSSLSHANQRLFGYHMLNAKSGKYTVQFMAKKNVATDIQLRCYLRTDKFPQETSEVLGEGFFTNVGFGGVNSETSLTNEYQQHQLNFDLSKAQKNPWGSNGQTASTPEMLQDIYICFNFTDKKAGEVMLYDFKFIQTPQNN